MNHVNTPGSPLYHQEPVSIQYIAPPTTPFQPANGAEPELHLARINSRGTSMKRRRVKVPAPVLPPSEYSPLPSTQTSPAMGFPNMQNIMLPPQEPTLNNFQQAAQSIQQNFKPMMPMSYQSSPPRAVAASLNQKVFTQDSVMIPYCHVNNGLVSEYVQEIRNFQITKQTDTSCSIFFQWNARTCFVDLLITYYKNEDDTAIFRLPTCLSEKGTRELLSFILESMKGHVELPSWLLNPQYPSISLAPCVMKPLKMEQDDKMTTIKLVSPMPPPTEGRALYNIHHQEPRFNVEEYYVSQFGSYFPNSDYSTSHDSSCPSTPATPHAVRGMYAPLVVSPSSCLTTSPLTPNHQMPDNGPNYFDHVSDQTTRSNTGNIYGMPPCDVPMTLARSEDLVGSRKKGIISRLLSR